MRKIINIDPKIKIGDIDEAIQVPKIIRVKDFNESGLESFEKDISEAEETGQPVIPIIIDSFGGSVYSCLGMMSAIENCRVPVATIVTSKAMSAGAILFGFGTEGYRYMDKNAYLMIHDAGTFQMGKIEEIKADTNHLDFLNKRMYKRLAKHLGYEESYFLDLLDKYNHVDWYLTAQEAKRHRIANFLKIPSFEIKIGLEMTFG